MSKLLEMNLTNMGDTVIPVAGRLYVKTPEALGTLLSELRATGFKIDDLRESKDRLDREMSVEYMEKKGHSLWFAHLVDISRGRCYSCDGLISTAGIQAHGHKCELCGATTYSKIRDGSMVRFSFIDRSDEDRWGMADLTLKAKRWDTEEGYLYFYPEVRPEEQRGFWFPRDRAEEYLNAHSDKWEMVTKYGKKLIRVKYPDPWDYNIAAINPSDIHGHYWNHKIVRVWQGKEYPEIFGDFPIPETISIYEAWHWPKHKVSPTLHRTILHACGQTDDKGWHYQNGTPWFTKGHWQEMSTFIRHFTELDADAFDRACFLFRSDGPGGIDDLANFCHHDAEVTNKPNLGNLVHGLGKVMSGKRLTGGEVAAMEHAASDRGIVRTFASVLTGRRY